MYHDYHDSWESERLIILIHCLLYANYIRIMYFFIYALKVKLLTKFIKITTFCKLFSNYKLIKSSSILLLFMKRQIGNYTYYTNIVIKV